MKFVHVKVPCSVDGYFAYCLITIRILTSRNMLQNAAGCHCKFTILSWVPDVGISLYESLISILL